MFRALRLLLLGAEIMPLADAAERLAGAAKAQAETAMTLAGLGQMDAARRAQGRAEGYQEAAALILANAKGEPWPK